MATTPPSSPTPASAAARAKDAARGEAKASEVADDGPRGRRRVPALAVGLLGALAALAYGHVVLGMRLGPPLVMTGLGGLTLVLAAFALWRVVDPLTRDEVRAAAEARAPHRLRELDREKQAVLKAIKEIELDYQMRKISEADYREMVERYRARALRVMGELAAGDDYRALIERELKDRLAAIRAGAVAAVANGAPDAAPAPVTKAEPAATSRAVCAACATANDPDARFCKRCGVALAPPPSGRPQ